MRMKKNLKIGYALAALFSILFISSCSNSARVDIPNEEKSFSRRSLDSNEPELHFYPSNLTAAEAGKIMLKIMQKQDFYISTALGYQKHDYILAKSFSVFYNGKTIKFRAIDCAYPGYQDVIIYGSQKPVCWKPVNADTIQGCDVKYCDVVEYFPRTRPLPIVHRRYEFNTSIQYSSTFRTCWVVVDSESIDNFEFILAR